MQPPEFLVRMKQPLRGLVQLLIMGISALLYMLVFCYWWKPWGTPGAADAQFFGFGSPAVFCLWTICCFGWFSWWAFHLGNWPFHKIAQPWQGICSFLACNVGFSITFLFFYNYLGWGDQLFSLMVCWYFWVLVFSTLSGMPLLIAYGGKQPLAGIVGFLCTWSFAFITWYLLPVSGELFYQKASVGFPFPWFLILCITFWYSMMYPMGNIKQPLNLVIHIGVLTFWMLVALVVLRAFGLNYWEPFVGAHYLEAGVWIAIAINFAIWIPTTFQMWPFHRMPFWPRLVLWLIIIIGASTLIWSFISGNAPPAATMEADKAAWFAHTSYMFKILAWNMALFVTWLGWTFNTYAVFIPPIEGTTLPPEVAVGEG